MSTQSDIVSALRSAASGAAAIGAALPEPWGVVVRIVAAATGAAAVALDSGKSEAEVVASIHRIRAIDTSAEDAEIDARVAAKPSRVAPSIEAAVLIEVDRKELAKILRDPQIGNHLSQEQRAALRRAAAIARTTGEPA